MYSSCEALTAPVIGSRSYCVPRYQRTGPSSLKRTRLLQWAANCWRIVSQLVIVVDVCDHDDDGCVVRAIRINAIVDWQSFEELGQIVQVHLRQLLRAFLVVHVLDVYASVGNESL